MLIQPRIYFSLSKTLFYSRYTDELMLFYYNSELENTWKLLVITMQMRRIL